MHINRREALSFLAGLAVSPLHLHAGNEPTLRLGTFSAEVTIPIGHPCMGGGISPAKKIEDPLFANGFVLTGADKPLVYVAVDWCEIRNDAYDRWRKAIAEAVGTEPVRVLVSAIHQHDAPVADLTAQKLLEEYKCQGAICNMEFHEKAVQRVAKAAKECLANAKPVTHIGTGQAKVETVASNRRYIDESGKVRYDRMSRAVDPKIRAAEDGTIDPFLKTLSLWNGEQPLAALSAYATHPMSYYGSGGVSADFPGLARKRRQADDPKVLQIYLSGCSGNVTAGKYNDGNPANRSVLADRLYSAMKEAWKATKKQPLEKITLRNVPLQLEARSGEGFSADQLLNRLKNDLKPFGQCLAALGLSWRKRVESGQPIDLPVIDFGPAQFAILPAEAYVEFQLFAQKVRPDVFSMVAGYGECGPGYIPIERAWKENDGNLNDWCWVNPGSQAKMENAMTMALRNAES
ncbi:MAG TPA: hypothetical protein VKS79_22725 [Gemmataceae bacterium]|nr:hypothetical protein [Gemmataceae bacterium]